MIDIQWVATIECQCWQDSVMIWQGVKKYRKLEYSLYAVFLFNYRDLLKFWTHISFEVKPGLNQPERCWL